MNIAKSLKEKPVVVCIGTSSVTGDSLGPLVGDLLREKYKVKAYVYGGVDCPVNGINYNEYASHIQKTHKNSLIFAVDACVGEAKDVGLVKFSSLGVGAGGALNKKLERIGDVGVLGVVAKKERDNLSALMAVPFERVEEMSEKIALKIAMLFSRLFLNGQWTMDNGQ
jgi:putative sporulation protein YyaC